jgi:hypothetical protein
MSFRFRYKLVPTKKPVVSLGGRLVRPRSLVVVSVIGPGGTSIETAHLDPGADDCVFPVPLAARIGVDLANAATGEAAGIGMNPIGLRYGRVNLRLANGGERYEWTAWVAFTEAPINRPLLGFAGCLQFFTATFHGDREELELAANSLFPGAVL